jgi:peptidoglycan/xylan/chitin deacetylase (PgdA/CDA1 family)
MWRVQRAGKSLAKWLLASAPGWRLTAPLRPPTTTVFTYHRVGPRTDPFPGLDVDLFRQQALWLKRNCHVIPPESLKESVSRRDRRRPEVLLTFDDGYRGYHDHVYPILKELGLPALVFLSTAYVDDGSRLFASDVIWLATQRARTQLVRLPWRADPPMEIGSAASRATLFGLVRSELKETPQPLRGTRTRQFLEELGIGAADLEVPRQVMSWTEVRATLDLTRYGGHTHTHPILSQLRPSEEEEEIRTCRRRIEAETGRPPTFFAYPNGRARDYGSETIRALRRNGFEVAFTTIAGLNGPDTDWMSARRLSGNCDLPTLAWRASGLGEKLSAHAERV